ncbi:DsbA family protein [Anaerobacillus sp. CMMVII]|uniref:ClpXP adapter SpxH family protein n=1 Tax=Anaerobacillus sp. CMMVII TaxID=2755588 RepID=UPI0021C4D7DA|nr:ClpXP adapter SpxH family protein [Anaerobacillus sp. CMMVII]MCT8140388.1 DsbA family protein [Anaerobacillus sp. CMMVII]
MSLNDSNSNCSDELGLCGFDEPIENTRLKKKPLEIYTFIDPLCPECWALEPILKKLQMQYCKYFTIRYIIGGKLRCCNEKVSNKDMAESWEKTAKRNGMSVDGDIWLENPIASPFAASIAIKAAELQGKQVGIRYLRKLRELLFLNKQDISKEEVLLECAKSIDGLDLTEFKNDMHSEGAIKTLQFDLKTTKEMGVKVFPTIVVFNDNVDEEGLMVTGLYEYNVYVNVLAEMLGEPPIPSAPVFLEEFLMHHSFVASKEISMVYDLSIEEVEKEMKKLVLRQVVERIPVKHGTFWRYIGK